MYPEAALSLPDSRGGGKCTTPHSSSLPVGGRFAAYVVPKTASTTATERSRATTPASIASRLTARRSSSVRAARYAAAKRSTSLSGCPPLTLVPYRKLSTRQNIEICPWPNRRVVIDGSPIVNSYTSSNTSSTKSCWGSLDRGDKTAQRSPSEDHLD